MTDAAHLNDVRMLFPSLSIFSDQAKSQQILVMYFLLHSDNKYGNVSEENIKQNAPQLPQNLKMSVSIQS